MAFVSRGRAELAKVLASGLPSGERLGLLRSLDPAFDVTQQRVAETTKALSSLETALRDAEKRAQMQETEAHKLRESLQQASAKLEELEKKQLEASQELRQKKKAETHPIYGRLLLDMGYKKIYASEPKRLVDKVVLPVWEKQRTFRPERAKAIAKYKKNCKRFGFPGVITIYDQDKPDKRGIVDGQHRIGGLEILLREGVWDQNHPLLTEVYTVEDPDVHVAGLFQEINQAQPAIELDMPGVADETLKMAIDTTCEKLMVDYPEMFKESRKCRPPHVNIDNLRQELFESDKVRDLVESAAKTIPPHMPKEESDQVIMNTLHDWILSQNKDLGARSDDEWCGSSMVTVKKQETLLKALEKGKTYSFYLGLDVSWL